MTNNNTTSLEQCANDLVKHPEESEESLQRKQEVDMENKLKNSQGLEQAAEELLSHLNDQAVSSKERQEVLSEVVTNAISQAQPQH